MGSVANCEWMEMILESYNGRHFVMPNGSYDLTTNVELITNLTRDTYKIPLKNTRVIFGNNYLILPFEYLCAKSWKTREVMKTNNTYTIHHFAGSWLPVKNRRVAMLKEKYLVKYSSLLPFKMAVKMATLHAKLAKHFL